MEKEIGELIKDLRKKRGLTLLDLSKLTGFSVSHLSMLERGLSSPTVSNLGKICNAFHMTLNDLLSNLDEDKINIKKDDRRYIFQESGIAIKAVIEGARKMKAGVMIISDEQEYSSDGHYADEFGFLLQGSMVIAVDGVEYELFEGDTIYITSGSNHTFHKSSKGDCISLWVTNNVALEDDGNHFTKKT